MSVKNIWVSKRADRSGNQNLPSAEHLRPMLDQRGLTRRLDHDIMSELEELVERCGDWYRFRFDAFRYATACEKTTDHRTARMLARNLGDALADNSRADNSNSNHFRLPMRILAR